MDCLPIFPDVLPKPLMSGYGYSPQSAFVRTQMDSGRARHRRRFKNYATQVTASWMFTPEQLSAFEAFFDYETCGGASWFRLELGNGLGLSCLKARFIDPESPYQIKKVDSSVLWQLTAVLETFEMPKYDEHVYFWLRSNSLNDLQFLSDSLRPIIHTDQNSPYWW